MVKEKSKGKWGTWSQGLKRNAVVAVVVLFVCVAVYLNWDYQQLGEVTDTGKTLGEAALVAGEPQDPLLGPDGAQQPTQGVQTAAESYFANARLNRQQARDSALTMLQDSIAGESVDPEMVELTSAAIQTMADSTKTEAQIENLVIAKGYKDCVAFIGEDRISVVVQPASGSLSAIDTARITDIVTEATSFTAEQIKIIEVS